MLFEVTIPIPMKQPSFRQSSSRNRDCQLSLSVIYRDPGLRHAGMTASSYSEPGSLRLKRKEAPMNRTRTFFVSLVLFVVAMGVPPAFAAEMSQWSGNING